MTPSPPARTARTRTRRRAAGDRRPGRAAQRRPRLGRPPHVSRPAAGAAETAAYLTAKAAVLERIAAEREAGGWSPEDARAARDAAARARAGGRHRRAGRRGRHHHPGGPMIDLKNHYGFTRTPFGKDLAPSMLHRYPAHSEAVARITWCARERALGVITGEVAPGRRPPPAPPSPPSTRPATPSSTCRTRRRAQRDPPPHRDSARRTARPRISRARRRGRRPHRRRARRAREASPAGRRRGPPAGPHPAGGDQAPGRRRACRG